MEYVVLIIDIVCALIAGAITQSRGRSWWLGGLLGFFLCGVGLVIVLFIPPTPEARILSASTARPMETGRLAPGWYADPRDTTQLRYWDGAWTQQTKPRPIEGAPPPRAAAPTPSLDADSTPSAIAPGWHDDPLSSIRLRYHDGANWSDETAEKDTVPPASMLPPPRIDPTEPPVDRAHVEASDASTSHAPATDDTDATNLAALSTAPTETADPIVSPAMTLDDPPRGDETDVHNTAPPAAGQAPYVAMQPAPGWYSHPDGTPQLRYWDGGMWTDAVAPRP